MTMIDLFVDASVFKHSIQSCHLYLWLMSCKKTGLVAFSSQINKQMTTQQLSSRDHPSLSQDVIGSSNIFNTTLFGFWCNMLLVWVACILLGCRSHVIIWCDMFGNVTNIYSPRVPVVSPSHVTRVPAPGGQTQLCPPDLFCRFSQILKSVSQLKIAQMFSQTFEKGRESLLKVERANVKVFVQIFRFSLVCVMWLDIGHWVYSAVTGRAEYFAAKTNCC